MSQGIATIALTPWERNEWICEAWRCASLSALANFIFAPAAATASVIAFCSATRNGSILSNETPIVRSLASADVAPAAKPSRPPATSARVTLFIVSPPLLARGRDDRRRARTDRQTGTAAARRSRTCRVAASTETAASSTRPRTTS